MKKKIKSNRLYLIVSLLSVILFLIIGSIDVLDPTNDKGYLAFDDGRMIELRHINNYIESKLDGIDTKYTIKKTLKEEVDYIIVSDKRIIEVSDDGDTYKVKINLNASSIFGEFWMYAYFEKNDENKALESFKKYDKISFKSINLNKVGFSDNGYLRYITFKDAEIIKEEDN